MRTTGIDRVEISHDKSSRLGKPVGYVNAKKDRRMARKCSGHIVCFSGGQWCEGV